MKNLILLSILPLLLTASFAVALDTVESPINCGQCGMNRTTFAQSRMLVVYGGGTAVGVCSLHCAALELHHNRDKTVSSLMVADYVTQKLLDAGTAVWVVGGRKAGVMTAQAKWAFAGVDAAKILVKENGGVICSFDMALNAAMMEVMDQAAEEQAVEREILRDQL